MSIRVRVVACVVLQCLLLSGLGAKYWHDRRVYPRVWAKSKSLDPEGVLRGRYLALNPEVDACGVAAAARSAKDIWSEDKSHKFYRLTYRLAAQDGKLVARNADGLYPASLNSTVGLRDDESCKLVGSAYVDFYVPDSLDWQKTVHAGDQLWVELTVPPQGLPRPINLAIVRNGVWMPLNLH